MARLELRPSHHGQGVFTTEKIHEGEVVFAFEGKFFLRHELPTPYSSVEDKYLQVGDYLYIGPSGKLDDYVNHSCDPNAAVIVEETPTIFLVAIRDIQAGEELTFDYSVTMNEDEFEMPCNCHSVICRKTIRDFKYLPEAVKERYKAMKIVPNYALGGEKA